MKVAIAEDIGNAFGEIMAEFLEGMPELAIDPTAKDCQRIVDECYGGNVQRYILESFENFMEQVVGEEWER